MGLLCTLVVNQHHKRRGPITTPAHKLTDIERARILAIANAPEYCNQAPSQIVPNCADKGVYVASESSFYRILRQEKLLQHRCAARPKKHHKPDELSATKPNQLWSWDISYLMSNVRGKYFYLYLFLDIFSRKIVGCEVFNEESAHILIIFFGIRFFGFFHYYSIPFDFWIFLYFFASLCKLWIFVI
jgi:putative transposase